MAPQAQTSSRAPARSLPQRLIGTIATASLLVCTIGRAGTPELTSTVARNAGVLAKDVRPTAVAGVYEYTKGTDVAYLVGDGRYAIAGDLYDLRSKQDLTETERRDTRAKLLRTIPDSQTVTFGQSNAPYTVTVFTDLDCAYCRHLHSEIAEYNRLGIRVRYLFFPRSGPDSDSWRKAEQVWCSANRNDALTRAKLGEPLSAKACQGTPVAHDYELGRQFNVLGTPAIVLSNGELIPGALPPDALLQRLRSAR